MLPKTAVEFVATHGNPYAACYANKLLQNWDQATSSWAEAQLPYILNNFASCRAKGHKEARVALKKMLALLQARP